MDCLPVAQGGRRSGRDMQNVGPNMNVTDDYSNLGTFNIK